MVAEKGVAAGAASKEPGAPQKTLCACRPSSEPRWYLGRELALSKSVARARLGSKSVSAVSMPRTGGASAEGCWKTAEGTVVLGMCLLGGGTERKPVVKDVAIPPN